ncbi:hypothetical protein EKI60_02895 [Candidatus Saccharibacteria bacterium]|nr:MAG: hypothetical protein EKI60_02895 [Candidatus Saccharibacteria bacterium]
MINHKILLDRPYNHNDFVGFVKEFLPGFTYDEASISLGDGSLFESARILGNAMDGELAAIEIVLRPESQGRRIAITKEAFKILRDHATANALIVFTDGTDNWRLSLLTTTLKLDDKGRVVTESSNPRRYSFVLGAHAKTRTPYESLIKKGSVSDIKQLQERFSVEVVNKQFYESIADLFTKLVGGERSKTKKYPGLLKINGMVNQSVEHQEFAVRLIGRIIFSWFLKEKKSDAGVPIVPNDLLSLSAVTKNEDYYHSILEPLFFELLNKRVEHRHESLREEPFSTVPYLNGGLFSPQHGDFYNQNSFNGAGTPGLTHIPNEWFKELFEVLEQYNFTVDENTSYDVDLSIDPEMLGRIFENLLAEINPETGESARKSTGSFYTPREIVDYMVDSSLLEFLKNKTEINEGKLKTLISWGTEDDEELTVNEKEKVVSALANLTILDPACGSGAFPIGILQKVVYVLQQVDEKAELWLDNQLRLIPSPEFRRHLEEKHRSENYDYIRKLGVIRESIFGVDIQTIATEIAKLRCFLTLIIDEEVSDDKPNRGVHALPNLDFKFVTANSLIGLPDSTQTSKVNLFEDSSHIDKLKGIRDRYFGADADERNRLRDEFRVLQMDMLRNRISTSGATSDLYNTLSDWDPFKHDKTDWFDSEWMFGVDSFDLVIANPPYVQIQKFKGQHVQKVLESQKYETYSRTGDIYCLFYEMGIKSTKFDSGLLCYITSNKWLRSNYGKALRGFMAKLNPLTLIDLGSGVFESAVVDTNILVLQNTHNQHNTATTTIKSVADLNSGEYNNVGLDSEEPWIMSTQQEGAIKSKIDSGGKRLKQLDITINKGLMTGYNDAFYFDKATRDKLIAEDPASDELIYKNFRGREINGYYTKPTDDSYVLVTSNYIDIDNYPAVKKHLLQFETKLKARAQFIRGDHDWFTVDNCPSESNLEKYRYPKIIYPNMTQNILFTVDESGSFSNDKTFTLVSNDLDIYYLAGLLNSSTIRYYLKLSLPKLGDKGYEVRKVFFENTPIAIGTPDQKQAIEKLVREIIAAKTADPQVDTSAEESKIDHLVYALYSLTPEEIAIVEGSK